jgi:hypothetical protein
MPPAALARPDAHVWIGRTHTATQSYCGRCDGLFGDVATQPCSPHGLLIIEQRFIPSADWPDAADAVRDELRDACHATATAAGLTLSDTGWVDLVAGTLDDDGHWDAGSLRTASHVLIRAAFRAYAEEGTPCHLTA